MKNKRIGTLQLAGLLTGAVLGSGIILLPPLAHVRAGDWAISSWIVIMLMGAVFASIFARMAILFPGSEGAPIAVRQSFGNRAGQLASNYVICAVLFGPAAVLMTASLSITQAFNIDQSHAPAIAEGLLILSTYLLLRKITFVSNLALTASITIALILFCGSLLTIIKIPVSPLPTGIPDIPDLGRTLLFLFWAIIGWEIIGNYSKEVINPQKSIPRATTIAVIAISTVYISTSWAVAAANTASQAGTISTVQILTPLFANYAPTIIMLVTCILCICTFLMIIGGISRLIATLAEEGKLPVLLGIRNSNNSPVSAIGALFIFHTFDLTLLNFELLTLEQLVAIANVFFLANALIAVTASMKIFKSFTAKLFGTVLCCCFFALLAFSNPLNIGMLFLVTLSTLLCRKSKTAAHLTKQS